MKLLGFWKELRSVNGPSLFDEVKLKRTTPVNKIFLDYLKNGIYLNKVRASFSCPLTGVRIGHINTYTDGEWVWTSEFIYYYEHYEINLPEELERKITKIEGAILTEEDIDEHVLTQLEHEIANYSFPNREYIC